MTAEAQVLQNEWMPGSCIFCLINQPDFLGVWELSAEQCLAEDRRLGARTVYGFCEACLAIIGDERVATEAEDSILRWRIDGLSPVKVYEGKWIWDTNESKLGIALDLVQRGFNVAPIDRKIQ